MTNLTRVVASLSVLALLTTSPAGAAPVGPVVNGDFELALPGKDVSCATLGDQQYNVLPPDQDPGLSIEDPTDPNSEIEVPWLWLVSASPCESGALKAVHWSSSRVSQWADHDGDGDREVLIDGSTPIPPDDSIGASHNFWQATRARTRPTRPTSSR